MESLSYLRRLLGALQKKLEAKNIMLLETSGNLIYATDPHSTTDMTALGALIIGVNSASRQLGTLIGEKSQSILVREGYRYHLLSTFITPDIVLAVFMEKSEKCGFARFKIKQYQTALKALCERLKMERPMTQNPLAQVTEEELDRLLGF